MQKSIGKPFSAVDLKLLKNQLVTELPPIVMRQGQTLIAPATLAALDSQGKGPASRLYVLGRVGYPRDHFVAFYLALISDTPSTQPGDPAPGKRGRGRPRKTARLGDAVKQGSQRKEVDHE